MSIYENPERYADYCQVSLKIAQKRCDYFLAFLNKASEVTCPECGADSSQLTIDDDGGDYYVSSFVSCTCCWAGYDVDDKRLCDWMKNEEEFDEILFIACGGEGEDKEQFVGMNWDEFALESTKKLVEDYAHVG